MNDLDLNRRLRELEDENRRLRAENEELRSRVVFFDENAWLEEGLRGETLIAEMLGGDITRHNARHDVTISTSKVRLEVKLSNLNRAVKTAPTLRWAWAHLLGADRKKSYDRLILMGVADSRFRKRYKDPASPFVLFDVPFSEVSTMANQQGMLHLTTNPAKARTDAGIRLYRDYQVTTRDLVQRYRVS